MNNRNSNSTMASSTPFSANNSASNNGTIDKLSPLIKLERMVFRLNSILSIKFDDLVDESEVKNKLNLLLEVIIIIIRLRLRNQYVSYVKHFSIFLLVISIFSIKRRFQDLTD